MDDQPTESPWSSDAENLIYAVNGRPGHTTVATLRPGADAELLAAAPDLLDALEFSIDCLEQEYARLPQGARQLAVLEARNDAVTTIALTRAAPRSATTVDRLWVVDSTLPAAERRANERLLDAAPKLYEAVKKAFVALAGHADNPEVVGALQRAMIRAAGQ